MAADTDLLADMCAEAEADMCVIDSLKDAALGLSDDKVGAGWNRARQAALVDGGNWRRAWRSRADWHRSRPTRSSGQIDGREPR
jgi:hypothetical protein